MKFVLPNCRIFLLNQHELFGFRQDFLVLHAQWANRLNVVSGVCDVRDEVGDECVGRGAHEKNYQYDECPYSLF